MPAWSNSKNIEKLRVHLLVKTLSAAECSKHDLAIYCPKKMPELSRRLFENQICMLFLTICVIESLSNAQKLLLILF